MEIKIDAKTVISNEGGFEPHPESYTPRVFAAVMPPTDMAGAPNGDDPKVYPKRMDMQNENRAPLNGLAKLTVRNTVDSVNGYLRNSRIQNG
jgi:hypothetical protein